MAFILGIETSCDETAAAVVEDGRAVLSNVVSSQIAKHADFGGVVPELAAREHLSGIETVVACALEEASLGISDISTVAVTNGPGLVPALLIGVNFARALAFSRKIPLVPVNHFTAHIYGAFLDGRTAVLEDPASYPIIALVVSGGHTVILLIGPDSSARIVGQSLDDAAGEAFDKGAKIMGLGYPGGPAIQKLAKGGDPAKFAFPRALTGASGRAVSPEDRFNFSFSGLKTAMLKHKKIFGDRMLAPSFLADSAASYQEAIVDILVKKTLDAAEFHSARTVVLCGGVACNARLREKFSKTIRHPRFLAVAEPCFCTDNAAMIAGLAFHILHRADGYGIDVFARLAETEFNVRHLNPRHRNDLHEIIVSSL